MTSSSDGWDRRRFLIRTAALLGAAVTVGCDQTTLAPVLKSSQGGGSLDPAAPGTIDAFGNESGLFLGRDPFVVGFLTTGQPDAHEKALADLRDAHHYYTELHYGSTDRFKQAYAEAALDHLFASDDLSFAAVAVGASRSAGGLDAAALYEKLLGSLTGSGAQVVLQIEHRFLAAAPDTALETRLEEISGVSVEFIASQDSNLLQLGDLLTGSIQGDLGRTAKGQSNPRGKAPGGNVKDRLIASLKRRLNVQRLSHPSLAGRPGFSVEVLSPPF